MSDVLAGYTTAILITFSIESRADIFV